MSNDILPLLNGTAFDPEVVATMGEAYDRIAHSLHDRGQSAVVMEVLAKRIIDLVAWGERDPDLIATRALNSLGRRTD